MTPQAELLPEPLAAPYSGPCTVCGKERVAMVGTRLTCHAACFWSPFDQETIRIAWEMDARLSVNEIADRLAVPRSTVWFAVRGKR